MARWARRPRATNATIRNFYQRAKLLARTSPLSGSMKLTMMGFGKRGGYILKQEKIRRKLPKQLKGRVSKTSFYDEGMR